jgi:hypothetical protein
LRVLGQSENQRVGAFKNFLGSRSRSLRAARVRTSR